MSLMMTASKATGMTNDGVRGADELGTELPRIDGGKHSAPENHPQTTARCINKLFEEASL